MQCPLGMKGEQRMDTLVHLDVVEVRKLRGYGKELVGYDWIHRKVRQEKSSTN